MLIVLYQDGCESAATGIAADISTAFKGYVDVQTLAVSAAASWPAPLSWDDLLVIVYNTAGFPVAGTGFIDEFLRKRGDRAMLLPVALDPGPGGHCDLRTGRPRQGK